MKSIINYLNNNQGVVEVLQATILAMFGYALIYLSSI
jgi:hypothetical protein